MILPVAVIGSSATKSTWRGYSCAARRLLTKCLDLARKFGVIHRSGPQNDPGLHRLGPHRVRNSGDRGHADGGMRDQAILDFAGADPVAGAGDQVIRPAGEPEIAVLIQTGQIAGQQEVAGIFRVSGAWLFQYPRNITGSGRRTAMMPTCPAGKGCPSSSTIATAWPGTARPSEPGRIGNRDALLLATRLHSVWP